MSLENFKKRPSVREALAKGNYHIELPQEIAENELVKEALSSKGLKHADKDMLTDATADMVMEPREKWPLINPDIELLEQENEQEMLRVGVEISKRKKLIQAGLAKDVAFNTDPSNAHLTYKGDRIIKDSGHSPEHARIVNFLQTSPAIQSLFQEWINKKAKEDRGIITSGEDVDVDPILFQILRPHLPEDLDTENHELVKSEIAKQSRVLLKEAVKQKRSEETISHEQTIIQIERSSFKWANNPLISEIRSIAREILVEVSRKFNTDGVTEFDLSAQVMMHLPTYVATEVWNGNVTVIETIQRLISEEKGLEADELFQKSISLGVISLNTTLVKDESVRHAKKLADYYRNLNVIDNTGKTLRLPAQYMGDPYLNPFKDQDKVEIDAQKRIMTTDPITGEKVMEIKERHSGKSIVFRKISPAMSRLYSLGFSNLYYSRDGEIAAYGAFLEGDEFPFAYSSYSPVTRKYTQDMLRHLDVNPLSILESTRAWNAYWAPENTMSTLFSYCHERLKEEDRQTNPGTKLPELGGVITSINPNLGFKAVSFRGVRFNIAGVKPTSFSYLKDSDGATAFKPKNAIKAELGITSDTELERSDRFLTNQMPFLPTLELLALFDNKREQDLMTKPIYRVSQEAFNKN